MSLAALGACASAIYAFFLLWGLLQERLASHAYPLSASASGSTGAGASGALGALLAFLSSHAPAYVADAAGAPAAHKFSSPLFVNALQSLFCALIAAAYILLVQARNSRAPTLDKLGLRAVLTADGAERIRKPAPPSGADKGKAAAAGAPNGKTNGHAHAKGSGAPRRGLLPPLLSRYISISLSQSIASQLGFLALRQGLSYPTLTLAKSCKLVPVLIMNVLLYRRRFAPYKYAVVALVTLGISVFMLYGPAKKGGGGKARKAESGNTLVGLALLTANLVLDGTTNSTQDEVFSRYVISGPQMMLAMNGLSFLLLAAALLFPVHRIVAAVPALAGALARVGLAAAPTKAAAGVTEPNELAAALHFLLSHEQVTRDVLLYAAAGALGQVAIFETLERFGSLTLVSITVTRKLFTMLLSVFAYGHRLTRAQWAGTAIVFTGIGIEAREKRREGLAKKVLRDEKKALAKDA